MRSEPPAEDHTRALLEGHPPEPRAARSYTVTTAGGMRVFPTLGQALAFAHGALHSTPVGSSVTIAVAAGSPPGYGIASPYGALPASQTPGTSYG